MTKMNNPRRGIWYRPCQHCSGDGSVRITGVYADTLALALRQLGEFTGADLSKLAGCSPNAMNNRLNALEKHSLLESRTYVRKRLYRVI